MKTMRSADSDTVSASSDRPDRTVTIRDVAELAGVSPGTVSRAIRNSPLVNPETRKRIIKAVEALDYRPNLAARRLVLGQTLTVAVIAPFFTNPAVDRQLRGVVQSLAESEYDLAIHHVALAADRERLFAAFPSRSQVDGALLLAVRPVESDGEKMQKAGVPIVLVGASDPWATVFHRVSLDDMTGGREATRHLIELGHEVIGFLGYSTDDVPTMRASQESYRGYEQALEEMGLTVPLALVRECPPDWKAAKDLAGEMLSASGRPTAILAASDIHAVGVLQAAAEIGLRVPEELSVIGCGDLDVAEILGLTTVRQPLSELGAQAVKVMLEAIEHPDLAPVDRVLPIEVVQRRTTGPIGP